MEGDYSILYTAMLCNKDQRKTLQTFQVIRTCRSGNDDDTSNLQSLLAFLRTHHILSVIYFSCSKTHFKDISDALSSILEEVKEPDGALDSPYYDQKLFETLFGIVIQFRSSSSVVPLGGKVKDSAQWNICLRENYSLRNFK